MARMFGPQHDPDPELEAAMEKIYAKQAEIEIAWRKTYAGQWGFLFCTCKRSRMFRWKPNARPLTAGCIVHGQFLISPFGGEIL